MKTRLVRRFLLVLGGAVALWLLGAAVLVLAGLRDDLGQADVALVLGSKVELNGQPSPRLRARLDKTLSLYRAGWFPRIIASGGVGKEGFDEAAIMRDYLVAGGVPRESVFVDRGGTNTFASAVNTRETARREKLGSVLVVSQYFHLPRARLALRRCGFRTVRSAHADFFEWRDFYSSLRETLGFPRYLFRRYSPPANRRD